MTCSIVGCRYVEGHTTQVRLKEIPLDITSNLCEYHWTMLQQALDTEGESAFKNRLKAVDGGRYSGIIDTLNVRNGCFNCYYLNPKVIDPGLGYRCKCPGSCIAATLSYDVLSYLFWNLGEITEEQHVQNINTAKFNKIEKICPCCSGDGRVSDIINGGTIRCEHCNGVGKIVGV